MKKIVVLMMSVIGSIGSSFAWEHPLNPDRFPSVGLSFSAQGVTGDQSYPSQPLAGKQNREDSTGMLVIDTRLPLSNSFTLDIALGSVSHKEDLDETAVLDSGKFDADGGYFKIGARYYFNGGGK